MANVSGKRFNKNKFIGVSSCILAMTFVLTQFQNCAPAPVEQMQASQPSQVSGDQMRVVDDWNKNKLLFVQPMMVVTDGEDDVNLYGVCDRKSSDNYEWVVTDREGEKVHLSGTSFCEGGGFKLVVDNLAALGCDQEFNVFVAAADGSEDMMTLTKHCSL